MLLLRLVVDAYGDERLASWSLLALNLTILYQALGIGPTPDGPLLAGWIGTIWAVSCAVGRNEGRWWLAAGAFTGLACLGKYTGALLPVVVAVYLVLRPQTRSWIRRPWPWLGLAIALAIVSPVIWWNADHGWASFAWQGSRRVDAVEGLRARHVLLLLAQQFVVVTPYLFFLAMRECKRGVADAWRAQLDAQDLLLLVAAVVPLVVFSAASLVAQARIHWLAPVWWPLLVLTMRRMVARPHERRSLRWGLASSAAVLVAALALALVPNVPIPGDFNSWAGWREAADRVQRQEALARAEGHSTFVFSPNYKISSLLWFHRGPAGRTYAQEIIDLPAQQFSLFPHPRSLAGGTGFLVTSDQSQGQIDHGRLEERFASVQHVDSVSVRGPGGTTRVIDIWRCDGYRGLDGAAWH